uniref:Lysostaphin n=1 Tax=Staphylococcus staphylolyticus TaxID=1287 RepID=LSTP_STAST|nr:RecName: Full=Lysostaphin; AltName: Full=Glycyl-glycine endopeptidase; Flags: Precursor [Staphylococcus simulans bv. staphylolyticus]CAA29494.1 unnamed protein product [Staphylococcus simulans bv. staphylolyticus]
MKKTKNNYYTTPLAIGLSTFALASIVYGGIQNETHASEKSNMDVSKKVAEVETSKPPVENTAEVETSKAPVENTAEVETSKAPVENTAEVETSKAPVENTAEVETSKAPVENTAEVETSKAPVENTAEVETSKAPVENTAEVETSKAPVENTAEVETSKAPVENTAEVETSKAPVENTAEVETSKAPVENTAEVETSKAPVENTAEVETSKAPVENTAEVETSKALVQNRTALRAATHEHSAQWLNNYKKGYGYGPYPLGINGGIHYGVDFFMNIGTPVKAISSGKIVEAGWSNYGGGNQIGLIENDGVHRQWYMHLSKYNVKVGDYVKAGQIIGWSGSTGYSTAPHLHFQRMVNSFSNSTAQDPMPFLKSAGYGKAGGTVTPTPNTGWKTNKYGTLYKSESASFTPNTDIITRTTGPFRSMPQSGVLKAGQTIHYDEVMKQDGHVWVGYTGNSGQRIYLPVRTWNKSTNTLGVLWGTIK